MKKLDNNDNSEGAGNDQSMFVLTISETKLDLTNEVKIFTRKRNSLIKDDKLWESKN